MKRHFWAEISVLAKLFRHEKKTIARFFASSFGRAGFSVAVIVLVLQFLSAEMGNYGRLTTWIAGYFGRDAVTPIMAGALLASYVLSSVLFFDNKIVMQRTAKVIELGTMQRLVRHLLVLAVPYSEKQSHGDIIQAVRQDVSSLRTAVHSMAAIVMEATLAVGLIVTIFRINAGLAFFTLISFVLAGAPSFFIVNRLRSKSFALRSAGYFMFDTILQVLKGMRVIKAYRGEETEIDNCTKKGSVYFDVLLDMVRYRALANVLLESIAGLGIVVTILIGGVYVHRGVLTWSALIAFVMAVRALHTPLNNVYTHWGEINSSEAALQRIGEILRTPPEIQERADAIPLTQEPQHVTFENISFGYENGQKVLEGVTLSINAHETIGIVGPSGVGKSTLLNLIARFYDPKGGRVLFDGRDLRDFKLDSLYDHLAIVTQDPILFSTSIRENIRCGRPRASDEEVQEAARVAYIDETISSLPEGYDTIVGVGGRELSRGQAQRINVARAVLKNAPLLLLDEATSSLDSIAEAEVQQAIDRLMENRTTFVVAHRLYTLRNADRLIVLHGGRCVGFGPHEELLSTCEYYRQLWESQKLFDPSSSVVA